MWIALEMFFQNLVSGILLIIALAICFVIIAMIIEGIYSMLKGIYNVAKNPKTWFVAGGAFMAIGAPEAFDGEVMRKLSFAFGAFGGVLSAQAIKTGVSTGIENARNALQRRKDNADNNEYPN